MIKHILIAYDGSEQAEKAYSFALDLAQRYQSRLTVLAVATLPEFPEGMETVAILDEAQKYYKDLFISLEKKAKAFPDTEIKFKINVGHPAENIISEAEQSGVDHIVMGHRGKTLFNRWLLGSVAKQVIGYAHCAITIVK